MSDIDFFDKTPEELKLMEENGMYPPRFRVAITCGISTARRHLARIEFKGAVNSLEFHLPLNPSTSK